MKTECGLEAMFVINANGLAPRNGLQKHFRVGVGEVCVGRSPDVISTVLGSCVGVMIYDRESGVGGLAHVMLPDSEGRSDQPAKYADTAVPELLRQLTLKGANPAKMRAKIAGGAKMFEFKKKTVFSDIGMCNIEAVRGALSSERIPLAVEDTGENFGRNVEFHLDTGKVIVKVNGALMKEI